MFVDKFCEAWQRDDPPEIDDVLIWFASTMPLYPEDRLEWVQQGLTTMLKPIWPAPADNRG